MKRIFVIGICGAGKSTLSRKLQLATGLPLIHLDQEYWKPGWVEPSKEEWAEKVRELVARDEWIMDGNFVSTLPLRLGRSDAVVYLDFPRTVAISRVLQRVWSSRGQVRPDMAEGCPEKFSWEFLRYVWSFNDVHRPRNEEALQKASHGPKLFRIRNSRETEEFLKNFKAP